MTSKHKRKIARQNGAKAAGAKSPQGIETSSRNAPRHGLSSGTLVLASESQAKLDELFNGYVKRFQPRDCVEMNLINEMVAARWRQQRIWNIQTAAIDLEMTIEAEKADSTTNNLRDRTRIATVLLLHGQG